MVTEREKRRLQRRWRRIVAANARAKVKRAHKARRRTARRRTWRRIADPRFYLKAVIVLAFAGLVVLPFLADSTLAVMRPMALRGNDQCRVLRYVDGDTVTMRCTGIGVFRARLLGFDTPEKKSRCVAEARDAVTATWLLRKSIWEAEEMQVQLKGTDRYGRRLVRMFLDGRDVADIMIATGYARRYGGGRRGSWCT
ncbi:hypothetical protein GQE99_13360 [Maritimibacter sp. DP07]|uniref:TNase-like domain-containing protein n=1 Tax=Maritimibacter harenae TaxID=2606218 RepID=A0A845MA47_9RHOB|nr:thermonuclease family protein [Maritimibacter harenae]MZR14004.1 hypothetical protein [Maritimibacter harenae]